MKKNKKTVIAYLHTHFDPEWYKTEEDFNIRLIEIFDDVLNLLSKNKIPCFYFDGQVLSLLNYLKFHPEKTNLVKKFIKEKKLFIGPLYVSGDSFLVSGASLAKNIELGLKISKKFGENQFIGYLSDIFGHSADIFEIFKHFKIQNTIIWRGVNSNKADFFANNIKTTWLTLGYYQDIFHTDLKISKKAEILKKTLDRINETSENLLLLPIGGDHLRVPIDIKNQIEKINDLLDDYEIVLSNPFEYLEKTTFSNTSHIGEFLDNSKTYLLQGVYSARIDEKAQNARLEWELFNKIQPLNYFTGKKYTKELDWATAELIKNHAHDSIYGCSTDSVHRKVRSRQDSVKNLTKSISKHLIRNFKHKYLRRENPNFIGVFNFSNYPQKGVVKVITDKKIKNAQKINNFNFVSDDIFYNPNQNPMTEDFHMFYEYLVEVDEIKPFSFQNLKITPPKAKQMIEDDFIENEFLKLFILDNQISVLDKTKHILYENFITLQTTPDTGDSYNFAPASYPYNLKLKSSKIKYKGKIQSCLNVKFEENINLDFVLSNSSKFFEIRANFTNKKKNRKLQIAFNTSSPILKTTSGGSIVKIEREHDPNYLLYENCPVQDRGELKTNAYPLQKYVKANGLGIVTEGLFEYEIYKNEIKIALYRSTGIISNPKNPARKIPAGPPIECPDMQGLFEHNLRLAFSFEENLAQIKENFNHPFIGILGEFKIKNKTFLKAQKEKTFLGIVEGKPLFL